MTNMTDFYTDISIHGGKVRVRGYDKSGARVQTRVNFSPTLWLTRPTSKLGFGGVDIATHRTITGEALYPIKYPSVRDAQDSKGKLIGAGIPVYGYDDFRYQYIDEMYSRYGMTPDFSKIRVAFIDIETTSENGFPQVKNPIEELLCITVVIRDTIHIFSSRGGYVPTQEFPDYTLIKHLYATETEMLEGFIREWAKFDVDIISGWYINFFDIPYLHERICKVLGDNAAKKLSPWGDTRVYEVRGEFNDSKMKCSIAGVAILDYLELYQKFTYSEQPSWGLDFIANLELGERKLEYEGSFRDFYTSEWDRFVDYNIIDTLLVKRLDQKCGFINLALGLVYDSGINIGDVFSSVRMWDTIIMNHLLSSRGMVLKIISDAPERQWYPGAYVKQPDAGKYRWIVSFDVASMYPHIMHQWNISPEARVSLDELLEFPRLHEASKKLRGFFCTPKTNQSDWLQSDEGSRFLDEVMPEFKANGMTLCANGEVFRAYHRSSGEPIVPIIGDRVMETYAQRKKIRGEMKLLSQQLADTPKSEVERVSQLKNTIALMDARQLAAKIRINSIYGAFGSPKFRLYDIDQAAAVTINGQYIIKEIAKSINRHINEIAGLSGNPKEFVPYSDTDSVYVDFTPLIEKRLGKKLPEKLNDAQTKWCVDFCAKESLKIDEVICAAFVGIQDRFGCPRNVMSMKREDICESVIWVAKKRYAMRVWDSEGVRYSSPKLKVKGMEIVKSSTAFGVKGWLTDMINICLSGSEGELIDWLKEKRGEFEKIPLSDIAVHTSVNGIDDKWSLSSQGSDGGSDNGLCLWGPSPSLSPQRGVGAHKLGTPFQVKAAHAYNYLIDTLGLEGKHKKIRNGDKVSIVLCRDRNRYGISACAFFKTPPDEFGLDEIADRDAQYEKVFLTPVRDLAAVCGWRTERVATLW
jgi:DNA polymerase elongation subunit (family B)